MSDSREMFQPLIYSKNFIDYKGHLTAPKIGSKFAIDININNGQRVYNVTVGRKWIYFRELYGYGVIKKTASEGKRILNNKYWRSAKWDWYNKNCTEQAEGKIKKSIYKNWKRDY